MPKIKVLETAAFLKYFEGHSIAAKVVKKALAPPGEKIHLRGLIGSSKTILLSQLFNSSSKNIVLVLNDREEAAYFFDDLSNLGLKDETFFFPSSITSIAATISRTHTRKTLRKPSSSIS